MSTQILHFKSRLHAATVRHLASRLSEAEMSLSSLTGGGIDAILDHAGNPYLLRGAQERLRRNESRAQALLDNVPDVIIEINHSGKILSQNAAVTPLLGYDPEEIVGLNLLEFIHPEDARRLNHAFFGLLEKFSTKTCADFRLLVSDGSWRTLEATIGRLDNRQDARGLILVLRDPSARRQEHENAVRQKAARQTECFLAMLGHELQKTLTPALTGIHALVEGPSAAEIKPVLEMIQRNLELQSQLLAELLDLTRGN